MPTTIIHRHWFRAAVTGLAGVLAVAVLLYFQNQEQQQSLRAIYAAIIVLVALATIVWVITYALAKITLNASGIRVTNYSTLFASKSAECDWNAVQSVTVDQGGIFSQVFNYGTVLVQTADARPNLSLTYVPDPTAVGAYIDSHAQLGSQVGNGS